MIFRNLRRFYNLVFRKRKQKPYKKELSRNTDIWAIVQERLPEGHILLRLYETNKPLHYEAHTMKEINEITLNMTVS